MNRDPGGRQRTHAPDCGCAQCVKDRAELDRASIGSECIGFEQGCGCPACLAIDRDNAKQIKRPRPRS